jgi:hypothetical protein
LREREGGERERERRREGRGGERRGEGWRDGSMVKSTDCSFEGPEFKSQQPHSVSQPPIMRSDALFWCF